MYIVIQKLKYSIFTKRYTLLRFISQYRKIIAHIKILCCHMGPLLCHNYAGIWMSDLYNQVQFYSTIHIQTFIIIIIIVSHPNI